MIKIEKDYPVRRNRNEISTIGRQSRIKAV